MIWENLLNQRSEADKGLEQAQNRKSFTEPRLTFIEPKLTKHGDATEITAGFVGSFSP